MKKEDPRKDPRQAFALAGEAVAEEMLKERGMRLLERRYRCRAGEIDLILADGRVLVFAEVKTRASSAFGRPHEAVNWKKRNRIARAAHWYLVRTGQTERVCRFDVVEVVGPVPDQFQIVHFEDAFRL
jgi:putative endonuclease